MAPQLVVLVLNNPEHVQQVLDAWTAAGAPGATILHSTGLRKMGKGLRDDVPLFPSLEDLLEQDELHHRTLFTLIDDDQLLQKLVAATETITGDLEQPDTGILFTLPVGFVRGLRQAR